MYDEDSVNQIDNPGLIANLPDDDYYWAQQANIVNHLKELENQKEFLNRRKIVQLSPVDFLESFLETPRIHSTTRPTLKTTKKINFHGIFSINIDVVLFVQCFLLIFDNLTIYCTFKNY